MEIAANDNRLSVVRRVGPVEPGGTPFVRRAATREFGRRANRAAERIAAREAVRFGGRVAAGALNLLRFNPYVSAALAGYEIGQALRDYMVPARELPDFDGWNPATMPIDLGHPGVTRVDTYRAWEPQFPNNQFGPLVDYHSIDVGAGTFVADFPVMPTRSWSEATRFYEWGKYHSTVEGPGAGSLRYPGAEAHQLSWEVPLSDVWVGPTVVTPAHPVTLPGGVDLPSAIEEIVPTWREIPHWRPNEQFSPHERTDKGNSVDPEGPPVSDFGVTEQPHFTFNPGSAPKVESRPEQGRKPSKKGEKERKFRMQKGGVAMRILKLAGHVTESLDFINVLYDALPNQYRPGYYRIHGKGGKIIWVKRWNASQWQRMKAVYEHFDHIDVAKAVGGLVWEQIEDSFYARIGKTGKAGAEFRNNGFGFGIGPWDDGPMQPGRYWDAEAKEWKQDRGKPDFELFG